MEELTAVNSMLDAIGHRAVADLTEASTKEPAAQRILAFKRKEILVRGFPFNTDQKDLTLNTGSRIELESTWIKIELPSNIACDLAVRWDVDSERYLWDIPNDDWYANAINDVFVTSDVTTFNQIPEIVAQWIAREAAIDLWRQTKDSPVPRDVVSNAIKAQANAVNRMCNKSINIATGWTGIEQLGVVSSSSNMTAMFL